MKFGEKIRTARCALGLSQRQLAQMTGIAERSIQNYESGERMPKQQKTYRVLASALGVEESYLADENADFVMRAQRTYGPRGGEQARQLVAAVTGLYAGGELAEEDMDAMMKAIQDAYWIAKKKNQRKSSSVSEDR